MQLYFTVFTCAIPYMYIALPVCGQDCASESHRTRTQCLARKRRTIHFSLSLWRKTCRSIERRRLYMNEGRSENMLQLCLSRKRVHFIHVVTNAFRYQHNHDLVPGTSLMYAYTLNPDWSNSLTFLSWNNMYKYYLLIQLVLFELDERLQYIELKQLILFGLA